MRNELTATAGFELLAQLERQGAITQTALILKEPLSYEQCESLAVMFGSLNRTSMWLVGDLLLHAERVHGETYAQVAAATGMAPQSLMNAVSICRRVPRSRRRISLPFTVHAEVASLPPKDQDRWLSKTVQEELSRSALREQLAIERGDNGAAPQHVLPPPADVTELALAVCRAAKESGDLFLVPAPVMRPLLAALGEEG